MKKVKSLSTLFAIFFFLFPPQVIIGGVIIKTMMIFIGIPGIFGIILFLRRKIHSIILSKTLIFMLIGFCYLIIISGIYGFLDTNTIRAMVLGFIILFAAYYFISIYQKLYKDNYVSRLLWDLYFAGVLHSIIIIISFLSQDFRDLLYQWINVSEKAAVHIDLNFRSQGIVYSGFSALSTSMALLLITGIVVFYKRRKSYKLHKIILFNLGLLLIFVAIVLIARTGIIVVILGITFNLIWRNYKKSNPIRIFFTTLKSVIVLSLFIALGSIYLDLSAFEKTISFASTPFIDFFTRGPSSVWIVQELLHNHYFFPDNFLDLLFGTSNFGRGDNLPHISSDVGYVIFIFGAGIIGLILAYSFYLVVLHYALKRRKINSRLSFLLVFYFIILLIANLKDYYFIGFNGYSQIFFLLTCALAEYSRVKLYSNNNLHNTPFEKTSVKM